MAYWEEAGVETAQKFFDHILEWKEDSKVQFEGSLLDTIFKELAA